MIPEADRHLEADHDPHIHQYPHEKPHHRHLVVDHDDMEVEQHSMDSFQHRIAEVLADDHNSLGEAFLALPDKAEEDIQADMEEDTYHSSWVEEKEHEAIAEDLLHPVGADNALDACTVVLLLVEEETWKDIQHMHQQEELLDIDHQQVVVVVVGVVLLLLLVRQKELLHHHCLVLCFLLHPLVPVSGVVLTILHYSSL